MRNRATAYLSVAILSLVVAVLVSGLAFRPGAAEPAPVGGQGSQREMLTQERHVGSGTSAAVCDNGQFTQWTDQLVLSGTPEGTDPVITVSLQHSIDGGTTWFTADTYTAINATVTPAAQLKTEMTGIANGTPLAYGRCRRVSWTMAGTGTVAAIFGVREYRH